MGTTRSCCVYGNTRTVRFGCRTRRSSRKTRTRTKQRAMKKHITTSIVLGALAFAVPVAGQDAAAVAAQEPVRPQVSPAPPAKPVAPLNMNEIRHHIYVMEGALARAV